MMSLINVGIIGFGLSGRYFFAPYLNAHPGFKISAFVSSQTNEITTNYPESKIYASANELFNDSDIDLVVVATPPYTHFKFAHDALLAGKHVIIEKPFTITSAEAEELIRLSTMQKKVLAPFQNRRWDGDFLTVRKLIEENILGEIIEFESHFDRYRPLYERVEWKNEPLPGSGLLYDIAPHLIDQALCLFGKPQLILGDIRKHRPHGTNDDYFDIHLHYSTIKVILKSGVMTREIGPRFQVHGRKGSFIKYGLDVQEQNLKNGMLPGNPLLGSDLIADFGLLHAEIDGVVVRKKLETENGNYMAYFENIYQTILGNEELIVKPEDGKLIIEVIEKVLQSSKEKRFLSF